MNKTAVYLFTIVWLAAFYEVQGQIRIAVSKISPSYVEWIRHGEPTAEAVDMYDLGIDSALYILSGCSGLLLTGGEDVYPGRYGKLSEIALCEEIDPYRDSLEFALIKRAIELKMPVFGICRGEQILNVALGGTLFVDIPTDIDTDILHRCPPGSSECLHTVSIDQRTLLFEITGQTNGIVNSYHHQAIDKTGTGLKIAARSDFGVIEAIERADPYGPFMMGVQWHPERLTQDPVLAIPLAAYFLQQARQKK